MKIHGYDEKIELPHVRATNVSQSSHPCHNGTRLDHLFLTLWEIELTLIFQKYEKSQLEIDS